MSVSVTSLPTVGVASDVLNDTDRSAASFAASSPTRAQSSSKKSGTRSLFGSQLRSAESGSATEVCVTSASMPIVPDLRTRARQLIVAVVPGDSGSRDAGDQELKPFPPETKPWLTEAEPGTNSS